MGSLAGGCAWCSVGGFDLGGGNMSDLIGVVVVGLLVLMFFSSGSTEGDKVEREMDLKALERLKKR